MTEIGIETEIEIETVPRVKNVVGTGNGKRGRDMPIQSAKLVRSIHMRMHTVAYGSGKGICRIVPQPSTMLEAFASRSSYSRMHSLLMLHKFCNTSLYALYEPS